MTLRILRQHDGDFLLLLLLLLLLLGEEHEDEGETWASGVLQATAPSEHDADGEEEEKRGSSRIIG